MNRKWLFYILVAAAGIAFKLAVGLPHPTPDTATHALQQIQNLHSVTCNMAMNVCH